MFGSRSSKKTGLKIIIVGCGKVGVAILKQLANEGHDITIIVLFFNSKSSLLE